MNVKFVWVLACLFLLSYPSPAQTAKGFAVVELFTSEGCSSCPPADRLAAATLKEYEGRSVYILAYHVDYWNRLGWKDVYSIHEWSVRQENYTTQMGASSVYTPQGIVNGKTQFTGSDSRKLHAAINSGLAQNSGNTVSVQLTAANAHSVTLNYTAAGDVHNKQLMLALVQKSASSNVKAGENVGEILKHVNVVRSLKSVALNSNTGHAIIEIPATLNTTDCALIAFIQAKDGTITGATALTKLQ